MYFNMKPLLLTFLLLLSSIAYGQINMADSTAQVVGYWDKNETQTYIVTQEKYLVKDSDTTSRVLFKYMVDITIVDSTANSYTIDWHYRDTEVQSENPFIQKLSLLNDGVHVLIRTNELGVFEEVINWEEVRDFTIVGLNVLEEEIAGVPDMENFLKQFEEMYSTKEAIELSALKEIQQFYSFHGAAYKYGEPYYTELQVPNMYGGDPLDAEMVVWLDELNPDDNNFILRLEQRVNPEQLLHAVYGFVTRMAEAMGVESPEIDEIESVSNYTWLSAIIHESGWILYSIATIEAEADGHIAVEERIIELQ
jgi:hypothetical protein